MRSLFWGMNRMWTEVASGKWQVAGGRARQVFVAPVLAFSSFPPPLEREPGSGGLRKRTGWMPAFSAFTRMTAGKTV